VAKERDPPSWPNIATATSPSISVNSFAMGLQQTQAILLFGGPTRARPGTAIIAKDNIVATQKFHRREAGQRGGIRIGSVIFCADLDRPNYRPQMLDEKTELIPTNSCLRPHWAPLREVYAVFRPTRDRRQPCGFDDGKSLQLIRPPSSTK